MISSGNLPRDREAVSGCIVRISSLSCINTQQRCEPGVNIRDPERKSVSPIHDFERVQQLPERTQAERPARLSGVRLGPALTITFPALSAGVPRYFQYLLILSVLLQLVTVCLHTGECGFSRWPRPISHEPVRSNILAYRGRQRRLVHHRPVASCRLWS